MTPAPTVDDFNDAVKQLNKLHSQGKLSRGILRTPSNGICLDRKKGARFPAYEVTNIGSTVECLCIANNGDEPMIWRLQWRFKADDEEGMDGTHAFYLMKGWLKKHDIDLTELRMEDPEEAKKVKLAIPAAKIDVLWPLALEVPTFKGEIYHVDINSSYPYGVSMGFPQLEEAMKTMYDERGKHREYKKLMNYFIGYCQSKYIGYKYAQIPKYAIELNNARIDWMIANLKKDGYIPVLTNTDGLWFVDPRSRGKRAVMASIAEYNQIEGHTEKDLGAFKIDHCATEMAIKSKGAYGYVEDGETHIVVRGKTALDYVKPRSLWGLQDIYDTTATPIRYRLSSEGEEYGQLKEVAS